ncbi:MAG: hypothetical protein IVW57_06725 [Ktedonobacterales bacterium]|nr:hypothetical protein [Ktedonobacterales bacterium]
MNERVADDARAGKGWWRVAWLFGPSVVLLPVLVVYLYFEGVPHFLSHTLMGWNGGLLLLLLATALGRRWSRADGVPPLLLALYAMLPDAIYATGPYHRDWMDIFLFHPSLDETLPVALPVLAVLWVLLFLGYLRFRGGEAAAATPRGAFGVPH